MCFTVTDLSSMNEVAEFLEVNQTKGNLPPEVSKKN
jgi:hypothetical protein